MTTGRITVQRDGHVATVTIDNPTRRNAMSRAMWIALGDAMDALAQAPDLRCVVLRGAGTEAFGSGADISEFEALRASKEQATEFARIGHRAMHAVRDCAVPTVAAIQGACVGGGMELAACCDLRLCTDNSRFGIPIAKLGATLAYPELGVLMRVAGPTVALELLLEGRILDAQEAREKGLVTRVVAVADFEEELRRMVDRIVQGAPLSARWHKRFVERLRRPEALTPDETAEGYACFDTEDYIEGYRAFLAKQKPTFRGR